MGQLADHTLMVALGVRLFLYDRRCAVTPRYAGQALNVKTGTGPKTRARDIPLPYTCAFENWKPAVRALATRWDGNGNSRCERRYRGNVRRVSVRLFPLLISVAFRQPANECMIYYPACGFSTLIRWQYVGLAGFTILIWDHIDTFPAEVCSVLLSVSAADSWVAGRVHMEREERNQCAIYLICLGQR